MVWVYLGAAMHDVRDGLWVGVMSDWFEVSMHGHDGHSICKGREDWVQSP